MFWKCFFYDHKKSYHIWKSKTFKEKTKIKNFLKKYNEKLKSIIKNAWKFSMFMQKLDLRNVSNTKLKWIWDKTHDKTVRENKKNDINWYRYQRHVLISLLLSFAKKCMKIKSNTLIMKNEAFAHKFKHQNSVFINADILRFIWCNNSSDLNMIESCWWWMKRWITRKDEFSAQFAY